MKKQINATIKAHLFRSAFILLSLVTVCVIPFALSRPMYDQRYTIKTPSRAERPVGLTCTQGWSAGPDLPSTRCPPGWRLFLGQREVLHHGRAQHGWRRQRFRASF